MITLSGLLRVAANSQLPKYISWDLLFCKIAEKPLFIKDFFNCSFDLKHSTLFMC